MTDRSQLVLPVADPFEGTIVLTQCRSASVFGAAGAIAVGCVRPQAQWIPFNRSCK